MKRYLVFVRGILRCALSNYSDAMTAAQEAANSSCAIARLYDRERKQTEFVHPRRYL